jgi:lysozyme
MITENGLFLIKYFEGCKLTAYQDTGGIWTIGYGSTKNVHSGLVITQEEANARLLNDLDDAEKRVYAFVHVELQQCELDSLISQAYNIKSFPMLAGHLNECRETYLMKLLLYCHDAVGHELLGLKKRRYAEQQLFQGILWNDILPKLESIK